MTQEECNAGTRFYRSGGTKNAQTPTGERIILVQEATENNFREVSGDFFRRVRHNAIAKALHEGKSVPPEVLADYPDLQAKALTSSRGAVLPNRPADVSARPPMQPEQPYQQPPGQREVKKGDWVKYADPPCARPERNDKGSSVARPGSGQQVRNPAARQTPYN